MVRLSSYICAFTHAFLGDMPQQRKNSMMKTQRGNLGCRFCFAAVDDRGNLGYDSLQDGRYHFQTLEMRKDLESHHNPGQGGIPIRTSGNSCRNRTCPRYFAFSPCRSRAFRVPGPHAYNAQFAPGYTDTKPPVRMQHFFVDSLFHQVGHASGGPSII
jgi:hypothetical protein